MQNILIIDDDVFICNIVEKLLKDNGYNVATAFSANSGLKELKNSKTDLVFCDYRLPDSDGLKVLKQIKTINPDIKVIIITAYADVNIAVKLIKEGATDYITKPLHKEEILHLIDSLKTPQQEITSDASEAKNFVFGNSQRIKKVLEYADTVAPTNMSVLIQGETGSGKEFLARYIHNKSARKDKPFVALDCGAIPKELANSELFGHIKGSFTGAIADKKGVFEEASGGTLFLDEIGNLSYNVQVILLRTLQERIISRVGDAKTIKVDVRIISATNESLKEEVDENNFREDLYHRLNEFEIVLPSLHERPEDLLYYANHFLSLANQNLAKDVTEFDEEAIRTIKNYRWPGNLREMKNVIKRCVLLTKSNIISIDTFPEEIKHYSPQFENITNEGVDQNNLKKISNNAERKLILETLHNYNYNKSKTAKALNIDRKTLYNKLKQFDISLKSNSV